MVFIDLQIFGNFREKLEDFRPRNVIFTIFRLVFRSPISRKKSITSQENHWIHLKIGINVPRGNFKRYREPFFDMLIFCHFMGRQDCQKCHLAKNDHLTKNGPFNKFAVLLTENRPSFPRKFKKLAKFDVTLT